MPRESLSELAARLDQEDAAQARMERDAAEDPSRCEIVLAPNGQKLPKWIANAMRGPVA